MCQDRGRRKYLLDLIDIHCTKLFSQDDVVLAIGSLGYGGVHPESDIDLLCIASTTKRAKELVQKSGFELPKSALKKYSQYTGGEYFIFNARLELSGIPTSCIYLDLDAIRIVSATPMEQLFSLRTYVPTLTRSLTDYLGNPVKLPIYAIPNGDYNIVNYRKFFLNDNIPVHGSFINKLITNPLVVNGISGAVYPKLISLLEAVYREVNQQYNYAKTLGACKYLDVTNRRDRLSKSAIEFLETMVFYDCENQHRSPELELNISDTVTLE